jgi:hypothetical protein
MTAQNTTAQDRYILYGSHVSYATAKSRSYLRKKGIPFIEHVPGVPRFREYVRETSQNHRIPQLEAPEGIGHSSWLLAQRPSLGVMLNP